MSIIHFLSSNIPFILGAINISYFEYSLTSTDEWRKIDFYSSCYFHTKSEFKMSNKQLLFFSHNVSFHDQTSGNNTCVYIVSEICILERRICIVSASLFACLLWWRSREGKLERTDLDARIKRKEGDIEFDLCDKKTYWIDIFNAIY